MIPFADVVDVLLERKGAGWNTIFERRFRPLKGTFEQVGRELAVCPALLAAIAKKESAFRVNVSGPVLEHGAPMDIGKHAVGLMQLVPSTASDLGIDDRRDPVKNIRGGALDLLQKGYGNRELGEVMKDYGGFDDDFRPGAPDDPTDYLNYIFAAWARFRIREGMRL